MNAFVEKYQKHAIGGLSGWDRPHDLPHAKAHHPTIRQGRRINLWKSFSVLMG